jgi:hypothetical protein
VLVGAGALLLASPAGAAPVSGRAAGTATAAPTFSRPQAAPTEPPTAVLPGGVDLQSTKIDGGAGDHTLATPVVVTVAEDGAATVTTFPDDAGGAERAGAAAPPASTDAGREPTLTVMSATTLPRTASDRSAPVILACLGLLLGGAAAYALVRWSQDEPHAG